MSRFGGEDLFGSGAHGFHVGGVEQRRVRHAEAGADGAALTVLGKGSRRIEQEGTLLADDVGGLAEQVTRIEAVMDGRKAELVDDAGRRWPNVMMLKFEPGAIRRKGARLAVDYRVQWEQVSG